MLLYSYIIYYIDHDRLHSNGAITNAQSRVHDIIGYTKTQDEDKQNKSTTKYVFDHYTETKTIT